MSASTLGNAVYFPLFLRWLYDTLVLGFYCPLAWGCPGDVLSGHYSKHVSSLVKPNARLLDIGVGTGYFMQSAPLPTGSTIVLVDINQNPLAEAQHRIQLAHPDVLVDTVQADVFVLGDRHTSQLPSSLHLGSNGQFDVISCMLLLHCLPGTSKRKGEAMAGLGRLLKPDGVLVGATVLGGGVKHNAFGRFLMFWHNLLGVFHNNKDYAADIVEPLKSGFKYVDWQMAPNDIVRVFIYTAAPQTAMNGGSQARLTEEAEAEGLRSFRSQA
ncbi:methyltransferase domain-containing protein [Colletotrichum scovillei]|uniref:Methyltransferase domain-containing protein n=1 Tax=Colletotrichum scovillei TaxID=1209932 RepID=A0A9P7QS17_9PEZI|nr:methyltransferase domain-containing protein [Colletotrichum scovillei]KAG7040500.1 methyltransferase domain-containing protein [Colletotrichum scovillei]KAG7060548.1 methyltransferase domain-containing protein [Colletotrichum scovillei]